MLKLTVAFATLLPFVSLATAQSQVYGQCGGQGWTGPTTCVSGSTCVYSNPWYSQCLPGSGPTTTSSPPVSTTTPTTTSPTSTSTSGGSGLNAAAKAAGKLYFGTAVDNQDLGDSTYLNILKNPADFGQITAANSMKWDATEPNRGQFSFTNADKIANLAKANGQQLRGHNCVWHNQLPNWVSSGGFNAATLTSVIQTHCSTVVSRYKGTVYSWDVVNEPFNDDGTWRNDVFHNTLGADYVAIALKAARSADPAAKLYINDYNIENSGAKSNAMLSLVKSLQASGAPIDGVGFQCHFIVGQVPSSFKSNLQAYIALGLEVAITELDIRMTLPATSTLLAQQSKDYQSVIATCKSLDKCVGVTVWDFTDKYSWVPGTFSGQGAALPWDNNYQKKPAYSGIIAGFQS